jgi:Fur family transcriptional regulator, peroxide stress response regulator
MVPKNVYDTLNANARAVLTVLQASETHPTAQEVYDEVRLARPHIGLATVYRILRHLAEQGIIKVWGYGSECARYDARTHRHDHAFCTECGALIDVPIEIVLPTGILEAAALATGLEIGSHELRIYGRCKGCQSRNKEHEHRK